MSPSLVLTLRTLIVPFASGYNSIILPFLQVFRGAWKSRMTTISLSRGPAVSVNYLFLCFCVGRYSFSHRFQNASANACATRHCFFKYTFRASQISGLMAPEDVPMRKWFGVNASSSRGSIDTCVSGRDFTECSISVSSVYNVSSLGVCGTYEALSRSTHVRRVRRIKEPPHTVL